MCDELHDTCSTAHLLPSSIRCMCLAPDAICEYVGIQRQGGDGGGRGREAKKVSTDGMTPFLCCLLCLMHVLFLCIHTRYASTVTEFFQLLRHPTACIVVDEAHGVDPTQRRLRTAIPQCVCHFEFQIVIRLV